MLIRNRGGEWPSANVYSLYNYQYVYMYLCLLIYVSEREEEKKAIYKMHFSAEKLPKTLDSLCMATECLPM